MKQLILNVLRPTLRYVFCEGGSLVVEGVEYTSSVSFVDTLGTGPCPLLQPYEIVAQAPQIIEQFSFLCLGSSISVGGNTYTEAGLYVDSLFSTAGCDSVVITTVKTAGIEVNISETVFELELGETVFLSSTTVLTDDPTFSWSPPEAFSCTDCPNPIFQPLVSGTYTLIATDAPSGCADTVNFRAQVLPCDGLYLPNAFSPNNDGVNDYFELFAKPCYRLLSSVRIFDRWGGLVREATGLEVMSGMNLWDGRVGQEPAALGVYVYQIELELIDGTTQWLSGDVLLLP